LRHLRHLTRRHHVAILAIWSVLVLVSIPFAVHETDRLTTSDLEVRSSQSDRADRTMSRHFPQVSPEGVALLVEGGPTATPANYLAALARLQDSVSAGTEMSLSPVAQRRMENIKPGVRQRFILPLVVHATHRQTVDDAIAMFKKLKPEAAQSGPVQVRFLGNSAQLAVLHDFTEKSAEDGEILAFPLVLIALIVVFGSITAALFPVVLGISSALLTGAIVYGLSRHLALSVFTVNVASMLGIGFAIDYSLFMLVRYREEIARGVDRTRAREIMLDTSGRAVVFAGGTVLLSLVSLFLINNVILRSLAGGAMIVVFMSVIVSVVVLPAMLSLFGDRIAVGRVGGMFIGERLRRRGGSSRRSKQETKRDEDGFWRGWVEKVTSRPFLSLVLSGSLLIAMSIPVLSIKLGEDTLHQLPRDSRTRQAAEVAARLQGPDAESPVVVAASYARRQEALAAQEVMRSAQGIAEHDPEVARVTAPQLSADGLAYELMATLRHAPESAAAVSAVYRLRRELRARVRDPHRALTVGGTTATSVDATDDISHNLWKVIAGVLLLSYVCLLVVLRSVILPIKTIVTNLLVIGAATGVLVMVFQWGWLDGVLGLERIGQVGYVIPPLIFAVVYGLSMDYELFLVTRIQERYRQTGDNRRAVQEGTISSARAISCAAFLMVLIFAAFVVTSASEIQEIGVGAGVAIAIDATLGRLVLLPASMTLLGKWNWWMPRALSRSGRALDLASAERHAQISPDRAASESGGDRA
jgi:uncharacterized membrane protein YdfJ with MMPL/SSD domain